MDYEKFVMALNKGLPGCVLAYDYQDDGCVLLVTHDRATATVTIPHSVVEMQQEQAISALCKRLRSNDAMSWHMKLVLEGDTLIFEDIA
jgi:hypothetical protein